MKPWTRAWGFLRRHKKAEEKIAIGAGTLIGRRVLGGLLGAGVAAAAIAGPALIDLSNNNGPGAVAAIGAPGVLAVEAKATEGMAFHDYLYPRFRVAALKAHKPFGGYLFLHPSESGSAQADYFLAYASPRAGDLQPIVDDEMGSPCSSSSTALSALRELKAKGYDPILYTSAYWLSQLGSCAPATKAFRIWEAEYGPVLNRYPGFHVIAWQYTDNSGVKGLRIDGSHLYASVASLEYRPAKPVTPAQRKARALKARKARLRAIRGGYFTWYAWREARDLWKGLAPHERDARPNVRHRIPASWWRRLELQVKAARA